MHSISLERALYKAKEFSSSGKFEEAISIYKNILKQFPKSPKALKAINDIFPRSNKNEQTKVINFYNAGQFQQAIKECNNLIQQYPNDPIIYNYLGALFKAEGDLNNAENYFLKSLSIDDKSSSTWSNISTVQLTSNKIEKSKQSCEMAIKLNPNNAEAHNNLGNVFLALNQKQDALNEFKLSMKINPGSYETHNNLGNLYQKLKNYDEAINYSKKSLEINESHETFYNLACAYREIGKFDLSVNNYIKSIQLNSVDCLAFIGLMELSFQIGLWGKFKAEFLNIIKSNNYKIHNYFYSIYNLIYSFTAKDFSQTEIELKKLNSFVNESEFLKIKEKKDKVFILAYFNLIKGMLGFFKNNEAEDGNNIEQIYHIGESHSLAFSHCSINRKNKTYKVEPRIIFGLKAWHLSQESESRFKSIFKENIKSVPNNSKLLISIGEIDCRKNEGIIHRHLKSGESIDDIIQNTISGYLSFMKKHIIEKNIEPYFLSIPAPAVDNSNNLEDKDEDRLTKLRISVVEKFNMALKENIKGMSGKYIDTHSITSDKNGASNKEFMVDDIHLHPKIFNLIQGQIL